MATRDQIIKALGWETPITPHRHKQEEKIFQESGALKSVDGKEYRPYVLDVDEWDIAHGQELAKEHGMDTEKEAAMTDFFAASFQSGPEVVKGCENQLREKFIETMLETPDYKALHLNTQWNVIESKLAAKKFADQFSVLEVKEAAKKQQRIAGSGSPQGAKDNADIACLKAVNAAIQAAKQEVQEFQDMKSGLGCGVGERGDTKSDPEEAIKIFNKIKNNPQLRRIIELAGRYRRAAQSKQRSKVVHGYDDMVGVELGGDVARLLPLEMAKLAEPMFEDDTMRRLVENQCMCRQMQSIEKVGRGPLVICIDQSGSMSGEKDANTKAFALVMAWVAQHEKRSVMLATFANGRHTEVVVLMPGHKNELSVLNWLSTGCGGGTSMDVPLSVVPFDLWNKYPKTSGEADMIILTDGIVTVPEPMKAEFVKWKKQNQVKVKTIIIGAMSGTDVEQVSDEVLLSPTISVESEAISKCLSI